MEYELITSITLSATIASRQKTKQESLVLGGLSNYFSCLNIYPFWNKFIFPMEKM